MYIQVAKRRKMTNEVQEYKVNYWIKRFQSEPIEITEQQFLELEKILLDTKLQFIKLEDRIINTSSIEEVVKIAEVFNLDKFSETGNNPYFREWCALPLPKLKFKEWLVNSGY